MTSLRDFQKTFKSSEIDTDFCDYLQTQRLLSLTKGYVEGSVLGSQLVLGGAEGREWREVSN